MLSPLQPPSSSHSPLHGQQRMRSRADDRKKCSRTSGGKSEDEATLYAWWAGYGEEADGRKRTRTLTRVHLYATRLQPTRPLDVGMTVRLIALSKSIPPIPLATLEQYAPYDPHVVGKVGSIVGFGGGWVRITVENECGGNDVEIAGVDIPHVPGVTVQRAWLEGPEACLQWVARAPEGDLGQLGREVPLGLCTASDCWLGPATDPAAPPFRVWPASMEERERRRPKKGESGEVVRHRWLVD